MHVEYTQANLKTSNRMIETQKRLAQMNAQWTETHANRLKNGGRYSAKKKTK